MLAIMRGSCRGVAQPGSALAWGARGREFESRRPDQLIQRKRPILSGSAFFVLRYAICASRGGKNHVKVASLRGNGQGGAVRVAVFGSFYRGYHVLHELLAGAL